MKRCYILASFLCFTQLFSYITVDPLPRSGTSQSGLGFPTSISNQQNAPGTINLLTGQSDRGDVSSTEVPSFQASLVCVKLAKTKEHDVYLKFLPRQA